MQVERRSKVGVEPERAYFLADQLAMFAEEFLRAGGRDLGYRRHRRDHIAQAIDRAALHIDAAETAEFGNPLRIALSSACVCAASRCCA